MKKRIIAGFAGLFFALLFVYAGIGIYRTLNAPTNLSNPGWSADQRNGRLVVVQVAPDGPAKSLRPGDEIVGINGQQIRDESQLRDTLRRIGPGDLYTVVLRRSDDLFQVVIRTGQFPFIWVTLVQTGRVAIPAIFLIVGFGVFILKPFDKQAFLLALMFGTFVGALGPMPLASAESESPWLFAVAVVVGLVSVWFAAVFFHFFLIFPEPSPLLKRFPKLERHIYVPHLLTTFLYMLFTDILLFTAPDQAVRFRESFSFVAEVGFIFTLAYIAGGLASLLINYRQASLPSRRKLRVVVSGSIAGFAPALAIFAVTFVLYLTGLELSAINQTLLQWVFVLLLFTFVMFPLSFAYAIVRHQVIPVRLILRRGVRYLLVSRGFIIIEAIVVFVILDYLLTGQRIAEIDRIGRRADIVVTIAATAIAVLLLRTLNRRVMPIIDRRFFRETYNAQRIMSELGQAVRSAPSVEHILELVIVKIQDALHTQNVTIFLCDEATADYPCVASSRFADKESGLAMQRAVSSLSLRGDGYVAARLKDASQPLSVDLSDLSHDGKGDSGRTEKQLLRRVRASLLVPIASKDGLLGIISLGPKLADLPFSREDKEMLMAVAVQMALAIENAKLIRRVAQEERLRHELKIAAEVQRRLFPESPPSLPNVDLFGVCVPAQGVGGDYYDFLGLRDGRVGIAVADVAGKGISAALLMSIVQASLRSQIATAEGKLTDLLSSMNDLLHRSTGPNSYASFFYAQYDSVLQSLTYVNAGHNPPVLIKGNGAVRKAAAGDSVPYHAGLTGLATPISLLETGGPVIGAFKQSCYEQETIRLEQGDIFVAYTDGVTEALNADGFEFGETRLWHAVQEHAHLPASELSEKVIGLIQEWCSDTPPHDDVTLVIMKVL